MLPMDEIECIRFLRQAKDKSVNEIAEFLGRDWETVSKYGDSGSCPRTRRRERERPKMGGFEETVRGWLEEDLNKKAKHRRNAAEIHDQLRKLGYEGSDRTTRHWVSKWKKQIIEARQTAHVRLNHDPGEAQVDLFEVWVVDPKQGYDLRKMHLLEMAFPYSSACLGVVVPAENAECVLQGLKWLFDELGGVPRLLIFDNLRPVVKKVLWGDKRTLTQMFRRFKYHYRFEVRFCNPASGHEKGSAECKGGYTRRRFMAPYPVMEELESFNRALCEDLREDMKRPHYRREETIHALFEDDQEALLARPSPGFEAVRITHAVVNRVGEISLGGHQAHLPWCHPNQRVMVKVGWDELEVFDETGETRLGSCPRPYAYDVEKVDWAAEWRLFLNRPRAVEQAFCLTRLPEEIKTFVTDVPLNQRRDRMETLIVLFESGFTVKQVVKALKAARTYGRLDASSIRSIAGYQTSQREESNGGSSRPEEALEAWSPNLEKYSLLVGVGTDE